MISESTYQAARAVAVTVENHFAKQLDAARQRGDQDLAPEPPAKMVEAIIDAAFWASLRREEGHPPKISLAFLAPHHASKPLLFKQRLSLTPGILTKLAPGVERPGIHLGVWYEENELYVWGTTLTIPNFCFVLDVSEPGLLVIKHRRLHGFGKFVNVAVLIGDQVKVVDEFSTRLPDCPTLLTSLLGLNPPSSRNDQSTADREPPFREPPFRVMPDRVASDSVNVLVQMAVSMRGHGHGGSLLIVPTGSHAWRESIIYPIKYAVAPAFSGLKDLIHQDISQRSEVLWQGALRHEVDSIAGLTAIDGATVINDQYELLAFGVKIGRREGRSPVDKILVTEPIVGGEAAIVHPSQSGGTRHLSAAQFVHDQRDALALIASQDGRFTIFTWSPCEEIVQAHRIDTLLL